MSAYNDWESDLSSIIEKTNQNLRILRKFEENKKGDYASKVPYSAPSSDLPKQTLRNYLEEQCLKDVSPSLKVMPSQYRRDAKLNNRNCSIENNDIDAIESREFNERRPTNNIRGSKEAFVTTMATDNLRKSLSVQIDARCCPIEKKLKSLTLQIDDMSDRNAELGTQVSEMQVMMHTSLKSMPSISQKCTDNAEEIARMRHESSMAGRWKMQTDQHIYDLTHKSANFSGALDKIDQANRDIDTLKVQIKNQTSHAMMFEKDLADRLDYIENKMSKCTESQSIQSASRLHQYSNDLEARMHQYMETALQRLEHKMQQCDKQRQDHHLEILQDVRSDMEKRFETLQGKMSKSHNDNAFLLQSLERCLAIEPQLLRCEDRLEKQEIKINELKRKSQVDIPTKVTDYMRELDKYMEAQEQASRISFDKRVDELRQQNLKAENDVQAMASNLMKLAKRSDVLERTVKQEMHYAKGNNVTIEDLINLRKKVEESVSVLKIFRDEFAEKDKTLNERINNLDQFQAASQRFNRELHQKLVEESSNVGLAVGHQRAYKYFLENLLMTKRELHDRQTKLQDKLCDTQAQLRKMERVKSREIEMLRQVAQAKEKEINLLKSQCIVKEERHKYDKKLCKKRVKRLEQDQYLSECELNFSRRKLALVTPRSMMPIPQAEFSALNSECHYQDQENYMRKVVMQQKLELKDLKVQLSSVTEMYECVKKEKDDVNKKMQSSSLEHDLALAEMQKSLERSEGELMSKLRAFESDNNSKSSQIQQLMSDFDILHTKKEELIQKLQDVQSEFAINSSENEQRIRDLHALKLSEAVQLAKAKECELASAQKNLEEIRSLLLSLQQTYQIESEAHTIEMIALEEKSQQGEQSIRACLQEKMKLYAHLEAVQDELARAKEHAKEAECRVENVCDRMHTELSEQKKCLTDKVNNIKFGLLQIESDFKCLQNVQQEICDRIYAQLKAWSTTHLEMQQNICQLRQTLQLEQQRSTERDSDHKSIMAIVKEEMESIRMENSQLRCKLDQDQACIFSMRAREEELTSTLERERSYWERATQQKEVEKLERLKLFHAENLALEEKLKSVKENLDECKQREQHTRERLILLSAELTLDKGDGFEDPQHTHEDAVKSTESYLDKLQYERIKYLATIEDLKMDQKRLQNKAHEAITRVGELQLEKMDLKNAADKLRTKTDELEKELEDLQASKYKDQAFISSLVTEKSELEDKALRFKVQLQSITNDLQTQKDLQRQADATAQDELIKSQTRSKILSEALYEINQKITALQLEREAEVESIESSIAALELALDGISIEILSAQHDERDYKTLINNAIARALKKQKQISQINEKLDASVRLLKTVRMIQDQRHDQISYLPQWCVESSLKSTDSGVESHKISRNFVQVYESMVPPFAARLELLENNLIDATSKNIYRLLQSPERSRESGEMSKVPSDSAMGMRDDCSLTKDFTSHQNYVSMSTTTSGFIGTNISEHESVMRHIGGIASNLEVTTMKNPGFPRLSLDCESGHNIHDKAGGIIALNNHEHATDQHDETLDTAHLLKICAAAEVSKCESDLLDKATEACIDDDAYLSTKNNATRAAALYSRLDPILVSTADREIGSAENMSYNPSAADASSTNHFADVQTIPLIDHKDSNERAEYEINSKAIESEDGTAEIVADNLFDDDILSSQNTNAIHSTAQQEVGDSDEIIDSEADSEDAVSDNSAEGNIAGNSFDNDLSSTEQTDSTHLTFQRDFGDANGGLEDETSFEADEIQDKLEMDIAENIFDNSLPSSDDISAISSTAQRDFEGSDGDLDSEAAESQASSVENVAETSFDDDIPLTENADAIHSLTQCEFEDSDGHLEAEENLKYNKSENSSDENVAENSFDDDIALTENTNAIHSPAEREFGDSDNIQDSDVDSEAAGSQASSEENVAENSLDNNVSSTGNTDSIHARAQRELGDLGDIQESDVDSEVAESQASTAENAAENSFDDNIPSTQEINAIQSTAQRDLECSDGDLDSDAAESHASSVENVAKNSFDTIIALTENANAIHSPAECEFGGSDNIQESDADFEAAECQASSKKIVAEDSFDNDLPSTENTDAIHSTAQRDLGDSDGHLDAESHASSEGNFAETSFGDDLPSAQHTDAIHSTAQSDFGDSDNIQDSDADSEAAESQASSEENVAENSFDNDLSPNGNTDAIRLTAQRDFEGLDGDLDSEPAESQVSSAEIVAEDLFDDDVSSSEKENLTHSIARRNSDDSAGEVEAEAKLEAAVSEESSLGNAAESSFDNDFSWSAKTDATCSIVQRKLRDSERLHAEVADSIAAESDKNATQTVNYEPRAEDSSSRIEVHVSQMVAQRYFRTSDGESESKAESDIAQIKTSFLNHEAVDSFDNEILSSDKAGANNAAAKADLGDSASGLVTHLEANVMLKKTSYSTKDLIASDLLLQEGIYTSASADPVVRDIESSSIVNTIKEAAYASEVICEANIVDESKENDELSHLLEGDIGFDSTRAGQASELPWHKRERGILGSTLAKNDLVHVKETRENSQILIATNATKEISYRDVIGDLSASLSSASVESVTDAGEQSFSLEESIDLSEDMDSDNENSESSVEHRPEIPHAENVTLIGMERPKRGSMLDVERTMSDGVFNHLIAEKDGTDEVLSTRNWANTISPRVSDGMAEHDATLEDNLGSRCLDWSSINEPVTNPLDNIQTSHDILSEDGVYSDESFDLGESLEDEE